ncbi:5-formyltetrahydrofolate cyclo-ligase [Bordetella sp. FB-8]|uniref:5-formyltetrahydrofolate cyclo-ligase n=1 Tax=Bordetella sp. FB-8 TaxID=1159870 RepID=UPI000361B00D|nr:5-formyltetrahydrofolate cyclo-ligase [Bordetella sp. FB-8]
MNNSAQNTAAELRARLKETRAALDESDRDRGALLMRARLFSWCNAARDALAPSGRALSRVAAFWPLDDEPDLRPLLEQWSENGMQVCLPCVKSPGQPLAFRAWTPEAPMAVGAYGIAEPAEGPECLPDVILVPTLGYTDRADRLGYGGGYYDRTLAALEQAGRDCIAIGIAWTECRLPDDYEPAAHDRRLDAILTPDGWVPRAPLLPDSAAPKSRIMRFILGG